MLSGAAFSNCKMRPGKFHDQVAPGGPWDAILYEYHVSILDKPGDELEEGLDEQLFSIKQLFEHSIVVAIQGIFCNSQ